MLVALLAHLEKFASGADRSVQWAKDAETMLDGIEPWDEMLDEFNDSLSIYRPGGGSHLMNEKEMERIVGHLLARLRSTGA